MEMIIDEQYDPIVFFDVETTYPGRVLLEFGSISVCPRRLIELDSYSTLIRPDNPLFWDTFSDLSKGITREALISAPFFSQVADTIHQILHGKIWAGHNIEKFDYARIREAFDGIHRPAPEPRHMIDSLPLLKKWFGERAGDMKLDSLAAYFGFEKQEHRSLDDVRLNLEVVKHCGTVLFLESIFRDVLPQASWIPPEEVYIPSIYAIPASFYDENPKIRIMHKDNDLKLRCSRINVQLGIKKCDDGRVTFFVDASPRLREVLDKCDDHVERRYADCGGDSEWLPVVNREYHSVRLHLKASKLNSGELEGLVIRGTCVDAFLSLDTFDNMNKAGINLVVDKLIIHH